MVLNLLVIDPLVWKEEDAKIEDPVIEVVIIAEEERFVTVSWLAIGLYITSVSNANDCGILPDTSARE